MMGLLRLNTYIIVILGGLVWPRWQLQMNLSLIYGELRLLVRPRWWSQMHTHVVCGDLQGLQMRVLVGMCSCTLAMLLCLSWGVWPVGFVKWN